MAPSIDNAVRLERLGSFPPSRRPLRTYSRKTRRETRCERTTEPSPEKGEIEELARPDHVETTLPSDDAQSLPSLGDEPAKRGSILSFFKPVQPSSGTASCSASYDTAGELASTPPSSPPELPIVRKRRRLTTRPGVQAAWILNKSNFSSDAPLESAEGDIYKTPHCSSSSDAAQHRPRPKAESRTPGPEPMAPCHIQSMSGAKPTALLETSPGRLNTQQGGDGKGALCQTVMRQRKQGKSQHKVQTTLSLSLKDEPSFRLCKDCNILYNPLNERDRKDHAREHAAFQKQKRADACL
ncbi:hypothetical protein VTK73DRAFT_6822 [Phialemonium thermophilum]|uniref:N-acetyltransferase ESCO zinc-finger domain-containing protein n=1 Tax=Phialemonium thermophilum TaxID=223376 RepID=A0ABR3Y775_9PEZI